MSVYRDKSRSVYVFEFDRRIKGKRIRARKRLPATWSKAKAESYDRTRCAELYEIATGVKKPDPLVSDAVAGFLKKRGPELKGLHERATELALLEEYYDGATLSELPAVCESYTDDHIEELAPATIMKRLRYLTSACRYAWKKLKMGQHDPAAAVTFPAVSNERQVYIDRKQMLTLARACHHKPTRAAIRTAYYSGMRMGEIQRAERLPGLFMLADTKNGEPRIVPIHPKLNTCVRYEMGTRFATQYHFNKARTAVGMKWLHFHDLRHSAASAMINEGVPLYTVGAVLGHKSSASTRRYAHLATEQLAEAIGRIGQILPHQRAERMAA